MPGKSPERGRKTPGSPRKGQPGDKSTQPTGKKAAPGHEKGKGKQRKGSAVEPKNEVSFEVYYSEASTFQKNDEYRKAISSYTKALDLRAGDKNCLVARSQCYLQLGDSKSALADAEETLKEDKSYIKGLFQKAEALYQKGEFEFALMFYHRGNKIRPELQGFRLGIQKSQEAIENSIGDSAGIQLETKGDLSFFTEQEQKGKAKSNKQALARHNERRERRPITSNRDTKTVKQLLGELYADKEYLENLLQETENASNKSETNMAIRDLAIEGLEYLDTRTEFWQQQRPMYSRKRDKKMRERGGTASTAGRTSRTGKKDPQAYVIRNLEEIDEAQADGKYEKALKQSKKVLKEVEKWSDDDIPNRPEVVANLYSCIGNCYLELGDYAKAEENHNKDLEIGNQHDLTECESRALDNLGRVHARRGHFDKAIEVWERKIPLSKSALESTWLYHEVGRCYLEKGEVEKAKDYGEKSLAAADEANDEVWKLNATVLIAQAQVKLGDNDAALDSFERALEMAKLQEDTAAEAAIKKAIEDVNNRIVKGIKAGEDAGSDNEQKKGSDSDRSEKDKHGKGHDKKDQNQGKGQDKKDEKKTEGKGQDKKDEQKEEKGKDDKGVSDEDVNKLAKAIKDKDEDAIIDILTSKKNAQRQDLRKKYKTKQKKELIEDVKKAMKGDFEEVLVGYLMEPREFDAYCLQDAIKGLGTDEAVLNGIICSRTVAEMADVKKKYKEAYKKELEDDVKGDTSGDYQELLLEILKGERDTSDKVDTKQAKEDAKLLHQDGKKDIKPSSDDFKRILTKSNRSQLNAVFDEYKKLSGQDIIKGLEKAMSGDSEKAYLAFVKAMRDPVVFYAERLQDAMAGMGTNEKTLIRIICSREEVDLPAIKAKYKELYKKTLEDAVHSETSGDFREMLIKIIKGC